MRVATIILAAGQGTRMKSSLAKVLHPVGGKPMVLRAVETTEKLTADAADHITTLRPVVVIGRDADAVQTLIGDRAEFVRQEPLLGTGHAVQQATAALRGQADLVVVFYADMPLLCSATLRKLIDAQTHNTGPITLLSLVQDNPRGFGRIVRGSDLHDNRVLDIVEERECTPEQRLIRELNAGVYAFRADWLWDTLPALQPNSNGEYYLTDLVRLATQQQLPTIGIIADDNDELIGVNTRVHLSEAEAALNRRLTRQWMLDGVTIVDPATTYLHDSVTIGPDTVIEPNTRLYGQTTVGAHCVIGPNTTVENSIIGDACRVSNSVIEGATLEPHVDVGPFAHLRTGAYLATGVHMGNFGEIKNSRLGPGTKMGHFSYIGDAEIGSDVNIGAGTITVNYDGVNKNKTVIGDHAFIGSDSMLIAPVTISDNARTAAGSVVTRNVPENHIAIGVPARMRRIMPPKSDVNDESNTATAEPSEISPQNEEST